MSRFFVALRIAFYPALHDWDCLCCQAKTDHRALPHFSNPVPGRSVFHSSRFTVLPGRGFISELCHLASNCPARFLYLVIAAAVSVFLLSTAFLLGLAPGNTEVSAAVYRIISLLLVALWSAAVGVANSAEVSFQETSALWGSVLALAGSGVLAVEAWDVPARLP